MPESVKKISTCAFAEARLLEEITLPKIEDVETPTKTNSKQNDSKKIKD